jgi:hypothetical protein
VDTRYNRGDAGLPGDVDMAMNPRLLRPIASGVFDPRTIPDLAHWYDASDSTTVTQDSGRVANLADKVGGINAANSVTGSTQPEYITGGRNGRNVIRFVAGQSTELILSSGVTFGTGGNLIFTSVCVYFRDNSTHILGSMGFNIGVNISYHHFLSNTQMGSHTSAAATNFNLASNAGTGGFIITTARNAGTSCVMRLNGVQYTDTTSTGVTNITARNSTRIGRTNVSGYMTGDIGEFLMWQRVLTADELAALERGLARKWGIPL